MLIISGVGKSRLMPIHQASEGPLRVFFSHFLNGFSFFRLFEKMISWSSDLTASCSGETKVLRGQTKLKKCKYRRASFKSVHKSLLSSSESPLAFIVPITRYHVSFTLLSLLLADINASLLHRAHRLSYLSHHRAKHGVYPPKCISVTSFVGKS